eukprot:1158431-Pelagomonas_calceolata.AAC.6
MSACSQQDLSPTLAAAEGVTPQSSGMLVQSCWTICYQASASSLGTLASHLRPKLDTSFLQ